MRKKSHISLAKYLIEDLKIPEMSAHRKAFYLGNILPDCRPSFLTRRHEFGATFDMVTERIWALSRDRELFRKNAGAYMRRLGEVIHYLADYFTFPHNRTYEGSLKDHCRYEKELKFKLREYVSGKKALLEKSAGRSFETVEAVIAYIRNAHAEYLSRKRSAEEDCRYIVNICRQTAQAILELMSKRTEKRLRTA